MKINVKEVNKSIWLLLPVAILISEILILYQRGFTRDILGIAVAILTVGAIIWIPSMAFTYFTENIVLKETSTPKTVLYIFGFETAMTFLVITLVFGSLGSEIPFLALIMSIVTQVSRWIYLNHNNRMYREKSTLKNEDLLDQ